MPKSIPVLGPIIKADHAALVNLIEIDTQPYGGPVTTFRFCTGWYNLSYSSNTYTASGNIIEIESMEDTIQNKASGAVFTISGVDPSSRSLALDAAYAYPGRPVRIYLAGLNADYTVAAADMRFSGFINKMTLLDRGGIGGGGANTTVRITCENKLLRLKRAEGRRMNDEQQRKVDVTDTGFRHLVNMRERVIAFTAPPQ
jgi:hypothetical protein